MENKINIAELLKDCPQGMELDCTMYENLYFDGIDETQMHWYPIKCYTVTPGLRTNLTFSKFGEPNKITTSKCVIFPKGKTTWEGFVSPCKFKDGDVCYIKTEEFEHIFIFKVSKDYNYILNYANSSEKHLYTGKNPVCTTDCVKEIRYATEEEKQKLFDAIKANGYKWNAETKTLEKLIEPKFKVGDRVKSMYNNSQYDIKELTDTHYTLVEVINKFKYTEPIIEDKNWELVPNKFDITTLVPFEDKVLVRNDESQRWLPAFWGYRVVDGFITTFGWCKYCIPYKGNNKRLLGTTDDCNDFYKTWEE